MAVTDEGQAGFEDVIINDPEAVEACELVIENKLAAADHAHGNRMLKEILPTVTEPTQFRIGEGRFLITVTPGKREGYEVKAGTVQRKKISEQATSSRSVSN